MSSIFNAKIDVLIVRLMIQNAGNAVLKIHHSKDIKFSAI